MAAVLAFAGLACKQGVGERCEVTEDCANPAENYCTLTLTDRNAGGGGTCEPRSRMGNDAGTDVGVRVDAAGGDGSEADAAGEGGADSLSDTSSESTQPADGATDLLPDLPTDLPPGPSDGPSDGPVDAAETFTPDAPAADGVADLPTG